MTGKLSNLDPATVRGFGEDWTAFDQTEVSPEESLRLFQLYFPIFSFDQLPEEGEASAEPAPGQV